MAILPIFEVDGQYTNAVTRFQILATSEYYGAAGDATVADTSVWLRCIRAIRPSEIGLPAAPLGGFRQIRMQIISASHVSSKKPSRLKAKIFAIASARGLITVMYSPGSPYDVFVNRDLAAPLTHYAAWAFSDGSIDPMFTGLLTNHTDVLIRPPKSNLTGSGGQYLPIIRTSA